MTKSEHLLTILESEEFETWYHTKMADYLAGFMPTYDEMILNIEEMFKEVLTDVYEACPVPEHCFNCATRVGGEIKCKQCWPPEEPEPVSD